MTDKDRMYSASRMKPNIKSTVTMQVGDHQFQKVNKDELNAGTDALRRVELLERTVRQLQFDLDLANSKIRALTSEINKLKAKGPTNGFPYQDRYRY